MAKAKFPGKPPKTSQITRLRVSSNGVESANDPSRLAAQQAAFGLKLFHQHFATDEEVSSLPPFRFSWLSAMVRSGLVIQHHTVHVARFLHFLWPVSLMFVFIVQDDDDFIGFEKVGDNFKPHFVPKTSQCEAFPIHCHQKHHEPVLEKVSSRTSAEFCSSTPSVVCPLPVIDRPQPALQAVMFPQTSVPEKKSAQCDQPTVGQSLNIGPSLAVRGDMKQDVMKKRKSIHKSDSGKLIAPSKLCVLNEHSKTTKEHNAKPEKPAKTSTEMPNRTSQTSAEESDLGKFCDC